MKDVITEWLSPRVILVIAKKTNSVFKHIIVDTE